MSIKYLDNTNPNHPEAKRLVATYGDKITHFGGGNESNRKPDGNFLWKPKSDSGKLVILTPSGLTVDAVRVGSESVSRMSVGNGWRPHWRFSLPGHVYGANVRVVLEVRGGGSHVVHVPNGGARYQTDKLPKGSSASTAPAPSTPAPAPTTMQTKPVSAVGGSITFPPSYADRVAFVALVGGKGELCDRDQQKPGRWTHKRSLEPQDFYAIKWKWGQNPPAYVKAFDLGPAGVWSYFDDSDFKAWPNKQVPVAPAPPTATPKPAPTEPAKDATLTATGLRLAPDLVPLVAKVLVLTHAETPSKTVKYQTSQSGDTWSTGQPLSAYPSAVYQIFWAKEPPARIPHHQGFPGAIKNVSHVMPDGRWNPPSTRNP